MSLKEIINKLVLTTIYTFIDKAIFDGELEANFVINFNTFPLYHFNDLGEFDGCELKSIWSKDLTINQLEKAGYSVTFFDVNYSTIFVSIKY